MDLTGYSGDFQVRQQPGSAVLLEASTSNNQMTLGGPAGTVQIVFSSGTVATAGSYQAELKLTDGTGVVSKPLGGPFVINQTVTP